MQVTISPTWFQRTLRDYADWPRAMIREFVSNGVDAGSKRISITVEACGSDTKIVVENDGRPMDRDEVVNKLLSIGGTTKNCDNTVGGFGAAKLGCYLAHQSYKIRTADLLVSGVGGNYDLTETRDFLAGVRSEVIISGDYVQKLMRDTREFAAYAQWSGELRLNGEILATDLRKGSPRRDLGFAQVYTNKTHPHTMIVRIGGIPMFTQSVAVDRCVVVELKGKSSDVLTANRDGLLRPYSSELSAFVTELAVDKRSALKSRKPRYLQYEGDKLRHCVQKNVDVRDLVDGVVGEDPGTPDRSDMDGTATSGQVRVAAFAPFQYDPPRPAPSLSSEFIVKNETDLEIPRYFLPDEDEFSPYSRKLIRAWGRILLTLHRIFEHEAEFAIGFVFDQDEEAQFEDGQYGKVYYVNPVTVVEQTMSNSRSFRKRFRLTERDRLIAIAAHEFVHGGLNCSWHDETFAARQTGVMATVMKHRRHFNWCFR